VELGRAEMGDTSAFGTRHGLRAILYRPVMKLVSRRSTAIAVLAHTSPLNVANFYGAGDPATPWPSS
jgi:hypothetical protein